MSDNKYYKCTKVQHRGSPEAVSEEYAFVSTGQTATGPIFKEPTVGECFYIGPLRTSLVREVQELDPGKTLIQTMNSYYLLEQL